MLFLRRPGRRCRARPDLRPRRLDGVRRRHRVVARRGGAPGGAPEAAGDRDGSMSAAPRHGPHLIRDARADWRRWSAGERIAACTLSLLGAGGAVFLLSFCRPPPPSVGGGAACSPPSPPPT